LRGGPDDRPTPIGVQTPDHTDNRGDLAVIDGDEKPIRPDEKRPSSCTTSPPGGPIGSRNTQ